MLVIAIASQKGGAGKTTLAGHLAVEAERAGVGPVTLIDTDPQGSLSQWWNSRAARTPHFAKVGAFDLESALAHLARTGTRLAIIDTPPAISDSISQVIAHADLVVVPTRPSPHDLRAVGATVDLAEPLGKPLIFVVNGATQRARITGEVAVALAQHGVVAPVIVHHRVDFAASMVDGRTVGEAAPKSASAKEIRALWAYIQDRVMQLTKSPVAMQEILPAEVPQTMPAGPYAMNGAEDAGAELVEIVADRFYYEGADQRSDSDRRETRGTLFAGEDKRMAVFGRRLADHVSTIGPAGAMSGIKPGRYRY